MEKTEETKTLTITWTFTNNKILIEHQSNKLTLHEILGLLELEKLRIHKLDQTKETTIYQEQKQNRYGTEFCGRCKKPIYECNCEKPSEVKEEEE